MIIQNSPNAIVSFVCVPAHIQIDGNEKAVKVAKRALKRGCSHINVNISKLETKVVIKGVIKKRRHWNHWNKESKVFFFFK